MEEIINVWKKKKKYMISMIFLVSVLVLTIGLYFYNNMLKSDIAKLKIDITTLDSNIKEVQNNKKIQIYTLLELNDSVIRSYKLMNKVSQYINHLKYIESEYNIKFKWFSLNNLELSTGIEAVSDDNGIAYQKTRDFLKNYKIDKNALFDLEFVNQITWMDNMKFKVNFKIKW